ncbi:MAG TPA: 16S rRNA (cytosine(967)-C(5))-methyltransferase RsmB [Burkholderiales bacterium]|nr:16S rRNA (cytosine(967)-C(5))-methyltransferase RsmB [Burkholderiales bacterium]
MTDQQLLAASVVGRVLAGRSLDAELKALWSSPQAPPREARPAVQDMAFGTLRFLGEIDTVLALLVERKVSERVRQLLRVALYQLVHTRAAPHAVVDHAVSASDKLRQPAAKGFVNAVLRNFLRRRETLLADARATDTGRYSHPQWWIEKLRAQYPQDHVALLDQANGHPPFTLRINTRVTSVESCVARLATEGIAARHLGGATIVLERALPVDRLPGFSEGEVSVQDAAAQYAALALDAPNGARVLDACAAPGGKTAHILERADVELTALDNDEARLARVGANLARLHLDAVMRCGDAAAHSWWDGRPYTHVLADVPCSGSGVVRRHPDIKWLRRPGDIAAFADRQREILDALWQVLAGGGKLLYSTCSVFHEENNAQIERFLERHPDARLLPLPEPQTNPRRLAGQILPDERHDGFFYALLQKN